METSDGNEPLPRGADTEPKIEILSIADLMRRTLRIPEYQRPYKWSERNIQELLDDADAAFATKRDSTFRYWFGTVILCANNEEQTSDIVDGQQRIISFLLLYMVLASYGCPGTQVIAEQCKHRLFNDTFLLSATTRDNLHYNYHQMRETLRGRADLADFAQALEGTFQVVVITVMSESEAFQLFDSQNSRGKELDPTDLLKAYHLREIPGEGDGRQKAAERWESHEPNDVSRLFSDYLYPIICWSECRDADSFTSGQIDAFKGLSEREKYPYARRVEQAMPHYQITEQFTAGENFFRLVDHYESLVACLSLHEGPQWSADVAGVLVDKSNSHSTGFRYARQLFECALLQYEDKFGDPDDLVIRKFFTWAFMHRVNMISVSRQSINKYAKGELAPRYSYTIPLFSRMRTARLATEIRNLKLAAPEDPGVVASDNWKELYQVIKRVNGWGGETSAG